MLCTTDYRATSVHSFALPCICGYLANQCKHLHETMHIAQLEQQIMSGWWGMSGILQMQNTLMFSVFRIFKFLLRLFFIGNDENLNSSRVWDEIKWWRMRSCSNINIPGCMPMHNATVAISNAKNPATIIVSILLVHINKIQNKVGFISM